MLNQGVDLTEYSLDENILPFDKFIHILNELKNNDYRKS